MTIKKQLLKLTHSLIARQLLQSFRWPLFLLLTFHSQTFAQTTAHIAELLPCELQQTQYSKSYWHPIDHNIPINSVAVLVPGLNLNHLKLNSLASALAKKGVAPLIVPLENPNQGEEESEISWQTQVQSALCKAQKWARKNDVIKIHAIGHSLGALTLLDLLTRKHAKSVQTLTLISPSIFLSTISKAINLIDWLPFGSIPSFNLPEYRLNDSVKLSTYRSLRLMREHFLDNVELIKNWPPTLIIMSPDDELIDDHATKEFAVKKKLGFKYLTAQSQGQRTIQHLLVDPPSIGVKEFEELINLIGKHFAQD